MHAPKFTTIGLESEIDTFFRLHSPSVIAGLRETFPDNPSTSNHFIKLRDLRNSWKWQRRAESDLENRAEPIVHDLNQRLIKPRKHREGAENRDAD